MSAFNITVESGSSKRLLTAGKYCDRDIIVTAEDSGSGASIDTCTVVLDVSSHEWYSSNKVRVFYTAYGDGLSAEYIETTASNTPQIYLYNVVCGSAIYLYTEVYCLHHPDYTRYTDEFHHCIICPYQPNQTITIDLVENS